MDTGELADIVSMYLKKTLTGFDVTGATGQNLVFNALNNARKKAERAHDFSICRQRGYLSVTSKADWTSPTWFPGYEAGAMRKGVNWWVRTGGTTGVEFSGTDTPLRVVGMDTVSRLERNRSYEFSTTDSERRYLDDGTNYWDHPLLGQTHGITRGKWLELYPSSASARVVIVDGYRWWPSWSNNSAAKATATLSASLLTTVYADWSSLAVQVNDPINGVVTVVIELDNANDGGNDPNAELIVDDHFVAATVASLLTAGGIDATEAGGVVTVRSQETGATSSVLVWLTEYTAGGGFNQVYSDLVFGTSAPSESDWWTENATEYLMYAAMVEANRLNSVFAGNREGNLPPPVKEAEMALQSLIFNDEDGTRAGGEIQQY